MDKPLFNEQGLQKVLQNLYGLDDQALEREVSALEENFRAWIENHFELTPHQQAFFAQMNEKMLRFLKQQCGFAAGNRLPITLQKEAAAENEADDKGDKLFEPKSKLQAGTDANGKFKAGGSLVIQVTYR